LGIIHKIVCMYSMFLQIGSCMKTVPWLLNRFLWRDGIGLEEP